MASFYEEINKKNKVIDEAENIASRASIDKWIFRLFLLLLGVMPLVVFAHVEEVISPLVSNIDILSSGVKGELFTHYKAIIILFMTIIISILFLMKVFYMNGSIRKTFLNYVLGVFVFAIVVSTIASPNISIALSGQYNRSDGAISWLCYIALMFIAMNIDYPKNFIGKIMYTMMPFVYINLIIITMNFYGKDILHNYKWVQNLVSITLPEGASLSEGSQLVGTLNQWNYMSGMFAMMTVMYIAWAILSKKLTEVVVGTLTAIAAMAVMLMSVSTSGFLTVIIAFPFLLLIILRIENKKNAGIALASFIALLIPTLHILSEHNSKVWTESVGFFTEKNPYLEDVAAFLNNNMDGKVAYASENVFELPILPERELSPGTGRMYIWGKTYELVKEKPLMGYGIDSLTYNFPHYHKDARSGMYEESIIVDKPHSLYMGMFYGVGVIGLLALLTVVAVTVSNLLKSCKSGDETVFILAITSLAYLVQAVFNDSLPGVTSVAWILIGVLYATILSEKVEFVDNGKVL